MEILFDLDIIVDLPVVALEKDELHESQVDVEDITEGGVFLELFTADGAHLIR